MKSSLSYACNVYDSEAAVQCAKETHQLFICHKYNEAYEYYMSHPCGGANQKRENTTLKQFCEDYFAIMDRRLPGSKFASTRNCRDNALPVWGAYGFEGDDYITLVALLDASDHYENGQLFHVDYEGYEFECVMERDNPSEDSDNELRRYVIEVKASPFDWISSAQMRGYDVYQLAVGQWSIIKDDICRASIYRTPGEAAKSICLYLNSLPEVLLDDNVEETRVSALA